MTVIVIFSLKNEKLNKSLEQFLLFELLLDSSPGDEQNKNKKLVWRAVLLHCVCVWMEGWKDGRMVSDAGPRSLQH